MMKVRIVSLFFVMISLSAFGQSRGRENQSVLKDSVVSFSMLRIQYGLHFPLADMNDRFGLTHSLGAGYSIKNKRNVVIGFEGSFLFSRNVKELNMLDNITGEFGSLIAI